MYFIKPISNYSDMEHYDLFGNYINDDIVNDFAETDDLEKARSRAQDIANDYRIAILLCYNDSDANPIFNKSPLSVVDTIYPEKKLLCKFGKSCNIDTYEHGILTEHGTNERYVMLDYMDMDNDFIYIQLKSMSDYKQCTYMQVRQRFDIPLCEVELDISNAYIFHHTRL